MHVCMYVCIYIYIYYAYEPRAARASGATRGAPTRPRRAKARIDSTNTNIILNLYFYYNANIVI